MKNGAAKFIEINPKVMLGKPVFHGTRITVGLILEKLSNGESFEEVLAKHPRPKRKHIIAAPTLAGSSLRGEMLVPPRSSINS